VLSGIHRALNWCQTNATYSVLIFLALPKGSAVIEFEWLLNAFLDWGVLNLSEKL